MTVPRDGSDARNAEFDRIFTAYSAPIFNYALRMVGDPDRAADIAQDTFIKAYRKLDTLTDAVPPAPGCTGSPPTPPSTRCAGAA